MRTDAPQELKDIFKAGGYLCTHADEFLIPFGNTPLGDDTSQHAVLRQAELTGLTQPRWRADGPATAHQEGTDELMWIGCTPRSGARVARRLGAGQRRPARGA